VEAKAREAARRASAEHYHAQEAAKIDAEVAGFAAAAPGATVYAPVETVLERAAAPAAAAPAAPGPRVEPGAATFTLQQLTGDVSALPVDPGRRHLYLSDEDFHRVFGMSKASFGALAGWKQANLRRQASLF